MKPLVFQAIVENDLPKFRELLAEDESVLDQRTEMSLDTTLHIASRFGHAGLVLHIVMLRPELVEAINDLRETPIHEACRRGSLKVLEILLAAKPWVAHWLNDRSESPLFLACKYGHGPLVKRLKHSTAADLSCVHIALSRGHAGVVQELIETWPSIAQEADANGLNLLHHACKVGESEIVRMLLILSHDLAILYDNRGFTPLHLAVVNNYVPIIKEFEALALLAFEVLTKNQETVFHLSVRHNQFDALLSLVQILGDSSHLFHSRDQEGNHILHLAVSGCLEIAVYLINKATKKSLQTRNNAGLTALDILERSSQNNLITLHLKECLMKRLAEVGAIISLPSEIELIQVHQGMSNDLQELRIQLTETKPSTSSHDTDESEHTREMETRSDMVFSPRSSLQDASPSTPQNASPTIPQGPTSFPFVSEPAAFVGVIKERRKKFRAERLDYEKRHQRKMQDMHMEALQNARNTINIIAILISTVTFTASLSPPGGFFQDGPFIGKPTLGHTTAFKVFAISNDIALFLSIAIVIVLVSVIPFRKTPMRKLLAFTHKLLWLALSFMSTSYVAARWATTLQVKQEKRMFAVVLSICAGFLVAIFVGSVILLINNKLKKSEWKRQQNEPDECKSVSVDSDMQSQITSGYYFY